MHTTHRSHLAVAAGLCFAAVGAISIRWPQPDSGWSASGRVLEAAFVAGLLCVLPALPLLRAPGRAAAVARWVAAVGFAGMLVSGVVSLVAGRNELGPVFFLGVVAALAGLLLLGIAAVRRRVAGWWTAPTAFAGLLAAMTIGDTGGMVVLGVAWVAIGLAYRAAPRRVTGAELEPA